MWAESLYTWASSLGEELDEGDFIQFFENYFRKGILVDGGGDGSATRRIGFFWGNCLKYTPPLCDVLCYCIIVLYICIYFLP